MQEAGGFLPGEQADLRCDKGFCGDARKYIRIMLFTEKSSKQRGEELL